MADQNEATFREVLDISVDLEKFKAQMSQVAQIYSEALSNFKGPEVNNAAVITALNGVTQGFERMSTKATQNLQDLTETMLETASQVEEALTKINDAPTQSTSSSQAARDRTARLYAGLLEQQSRDVRAALEEQTRQEELAAQAKIKADEAASNVLIANANNVKDVELQALEQVADKTATAYELRLEAAKRAAAVTESLSQKNTFNTQPGNEAQIEELQRIADSSAKAASVAQREVEQAYTAMNREALDRAETEEQTQARVLIATRNTEQQRKLAADARVRAEQTASQLEEANARQASQAEIAALQSVASTAQQAYADRIDAANKAYEAEQALANAPQSASRSIVVSDLQKQATQAVATANAAERSADRAATAYEASVARQSKAQEILNEKIRIATQDTADQTELAAKTKADLAESVANVQAAQARNASDVEIRALQQVANAAQEAAQARVTAAEKAYEAEQALRQGAGNASQSVVISELNKQANQAAAAADRAARSFASTSQQQAQIIEDTQAKLSIAFRNTAEAQELADKARVQSDKAANDVITAQTTGATDKQIAQLQRVARVAQELYQARIEAAEKAAAVEQGLGSGVNTNILADLKKQATSAGTNADGLQRQFTNLGNQISNVDSIASRFSSNLFRDMPELVANVIRFATAWKLLGGIINLVLELPGQLFDAIKNGIDYIDKLQEKTADMQGVIAANVTLSKDWTDNFKLAGDAAGIVQKRLEDIAIQSALNADALEKAFKATLEGGGGAFAQDLEQVVQLTQLFGLAMKAAGKDADSTRSLISEIPKLLEGSASANSKLLEVLHLTKDQWESIRVSALQHHDLLSQLAPLMQPYLSVVDQAAVRQSVLTEQLGLMKDRIEAAIAEPLWRTWQQILEDAKETLQDNEGSVIAMGRSLADTLVTIIDIGRELGVLSGIVKILAQLLNLVNYSVRTIVQAFQTLADIIDVTVRAGGGLDGFKKNVQDIKSVLDKAGEKFADDLDRASATAQDIDEGTRKRDEFERYVQTREKNRKLIPAAAFGAQPAPQPSIDVDELNKQLATQFPILGSTQPPPVKTKNTDLLRTIREEYSEALQLVKTTEQEMRDAVDEEERNRNIDFEDASKQRIASYQRELQAVIQIGQSTLEKAKSLGLTDTQLKGINALIDKTTLAAEALDSHKETTERDRNTENEQKLKLQQQNEELRAFQEHERAKLALMQQYAQEGLLNQQTVAEAQLSFENAVYEKEKAILNAKLLDARSDVLQHDALTAQLKQLETSHADAVIAQEERIRQAKQETLRQELAILAERRQAEIQQLQFELQNRDLSPTQQRNLQVQVAQKQQANATFNVDDAQRALDALEKNVKSLSQTEQNQYKPAIEAAKQKLDELKQAAANATEVLSKMQPGVKAGLKSLSDSIFGFDIVQSWQEAGSSWVGKMTVVFDAIAGGLKNIQAIIGQVQQGYQQGGVLGGIGAGLGIAGNIAGAFNPLAGAIIGAVGSVFSVIGGLFKAAAKRIAEEIKKEISAIENQYQLGQASLNDTIAKLQKERQDAVNRLSGKKGGNDELKKILPDLDNEIAQLQKQQRDIATSFKQALGVLQTGTSDVTTQWLNDWIAINKQVQDYIDAVGSAGYKDAEQFLTLSLQKERQKLQDQLNQDEQDAISDATQLNDLLQQRNQLDKDYLNQRFQLLGEDSIERRQSNGVLVGQQLSVLKQQHDQDAANLDYQIQGLKQKVDIERQVFNLATDTATLQNQSLALQLDQIKEQKQEWLDIISILKNSANLIAGPNGFLGNPLSGIGVIPGLGGQSSTNVPLQPRPIIHIESIQVSGVNDGGKFADDLTKRLQQLIDRGDYSFVTA